MALVRSLSCYFVLTATLIIGPPSSDSHAESSLERLESESSRANEHCVQRGLEMSISIEVALNQAVCSSFIIGRAAALAKSKEAYIGVAASQYFPTISATASTGYLNRSTRYSEFPGSNFELLGQSRGISGSLSMILYDSGRRAAELNASRELFEAEVLDHEQVVRDVLAAAATSFYKFQYSTAALNISRVAEGISSATVNSISALVAGGVSSAADLLLAKSNLGQATLRRIRFFGDWKIAKSELCTLIGEPVSCEVSVATNDLTVPSDSELQLLELKLSDAIAGSPAISSLRRQFFAAEATIEAVKAEGQPSLILQGSINQIRSPLAKSQGIQNVADSSLGLQLNIPIFTGYLTEYKAQVATAERDQKFAEFSEMKRAVTQDAWSKLEDLRSSLEKTRHAIKLHDVALQSFKISSERYKAGVGSILELLKAQSDRTEADLGIAQAFSEFRIAKLKVALLFGELDAVASSHFGLRYN